MQRCYIIRRKREKTNNKNIAPLDDDEAIVHYRMANSVQAERKLKLMLTQFKPTEGDPSINA